MLFRRSCHGSAPSHRVSRCSPPLHPLPHHGRGRASRRVRSHAAAAFATCRSQSSKKLFSLPASLRKPRGVLSKARPRRPPAPPAFQCGQTSIQVERRACVCTFAAEFGQASQRPVRVACARPVGDFTGDGLRPGSVNFASPCRYRSARRGCVSHTTARCNPGVLRLICSRIRCRLWPDRKFGFWKCLRP